MKLIKKCWLNKMCLHRQHLCSNSQNSLCCLLNKAHETRWFLGKHLKNTNQLVLTAGDMKCSKKGCPKVRILQTLSGNDILNVTAKKWQKQWHTKGHIQSNIQNQRQLNIMPLVHNHSLREKGIFKLIKLERWHWENTKINVLGKSYKSLQWL